MIKKRIWIWPNFLPAAEDVASGKNSYSRKVGDEEASMLLID